MYCLPPGPVCGCDGGVEEFWEETVSEENTSNKLKTTGRHISLSPFFCRGDTPWPPQSASLQRWGGHGVPPLQLSPNRSHFQIFSVDDSCAVRRLIILSPKFLEVLSQS